MNEQPETLSVESGAAVGCSALFGELVRKHQLAVETLTEQQLAEAIRQAIASGDFMRNVVVDGRQSVIYIPWREVERLRLLYNELLYAVTSKHEGETRHETAIRYIRERENHPGGQCAKTPNDQAQRRERAAADARTTQQP
mgnify:FL=1